MKSYEEFWDAMSQLRNKLLEFRLNEMSFETNYKKQTKKECPHSLRYDLDTLCFKDFDRLIYPLSAAIYNYLEDGIKPTEIPSMKDFEELGAQLKEIKRWLALIIMRYGLVPDLLDEFESVYDSFKYDFMPVMNDAFETLKGDTK